jgi:hypothetical protein
MSHGYSVQMTPGEAAEILNIPADAAPETVHRAFRAHARASHPDLFQGADPVALATAQAEFVRVTQARDILLSTHASHTDGGEGRDASAGAASGTSPADPYAQGDAAARAQRIFVPPYVRPVPRPPNAWAFTAWVALLAGAIAVSYFGGPFPESPADFWVRLVPLGLSITLFGATGRPPFLAAAIALAVVTVGITFWLASFGSLLSLEVLLVPVLALWIIGRRRMLRRALAAR